MQLSKSEYLMFLKHPAWLWLKKNQKHVLPPPDAGLQALFDAGHNYERYAEQLFPDGVRLAEPYRIKTDGLKFIGPEFHAELKKFALRPGDVVIVRTG